MIKLIAADLDGTLLNDRKEISPYFGKLYERLRNSGILFAVASGRQYYNLADEFSAFASDLLIIAENGAYARRGDEEIFVNAMDFLSVKACVEAVRTQEGAYAVVCGKKSAWAESRYAPFVEETRRYYNKFCLVDDLTLIDDEILKVSVCDFTHAEAVSYPYFVSALPSCSVTLGGSQWVDIAHLSANKGSALKKVGSFYGIGSQEIMAFGDYLNDREMLQEAGYSFAMQNAHPDIKQIARFVIPFTNNEEGVVRTINQFIFQER
ncbi:MAG: HAD family hydrolase [Bacteroidales bacterium]